MLAFGHTGITLGMAVLLSGAFSKINTSPVSEGEVKQYTGSISEDKKSESNIFTVLSSWLRNLAGAIDIRILLIGSLLPDIIDKPLGMLFFREEISNGRIYSHTLLFLIIITITGIYLYREKGKTWMMALSFGTFTHFILDRMWSNTNTLFWPFLGVEFQKSDISDWIPEMFFALHTNPAVYVPEIIGLIVLGWFAVVLIRRRNILKFIRNGWVG